MVPQRMLSLGRRMHVNGVTLADTLRVPGTSFLSLQPWPSHCGVIMQRLPHLTSSVILFDIAAWKEIPRTSCQGQGTGVAVRRGGMLLVPQVRIRQSSTHGASLTFPIPVAPREAWAGVEDRTVVEVTRGS